MATSDWGDWLPRAIDEAEPDGVDMWYLGCNGFVLKSEDGTTIFIDPYVGTGDPPRTIRMIPVPFDPHDVERADAILVTHEHTDHVHGPSQAPILAGTDAKLVGPGDSLAVAKDTESWADHWEIDEAQFVEVTTGENVEIGSFTVTAEIANDPDASDPVSYVIEHDEGTVFHGGDTKPSEDFERIGDAYDIDVAIVAFGTVGNLRHKDDPSTRRRTRWYCDENEVVSIANSLQADRLVPSHWDMWKGVGGDPTVLHHHCASWPYPERLEIVQIGDRFAL